MMLTVDEHPLSLFVAPQAAESIWNSHVANVDQLNEYARSMRQLAEQHWAGKSHGQTRVTWCYETIRDYFMRQGLERKCARDERKKIHSDVCENCRRRIE